MCLMAADRLNLGQAIPRPETIQTVFVVPQRRRRIAAAGQLAVAGSCPGDEAAEAIGTIRSFMAASGRSGRVRRAAQRTWPSLEDIVRAGRVIEAHCTGELQRLLDGSRGAVRALAFIEKCKGDRRLRTLAEDQGIELEAWAEEIERSRDNAFS